MNHYVKTALLLGILTAILVFVGYLIGGGSGALFFLMFGVFINLISFWFSDRIALQFAQAEPLAETDAPNLHAAVADLSNKMGIPKPRLFVAPQPQPNAFATGRSPANSAVCVTRGLLQTLNQDEVIGVLAHELAHIRNRDTLIVTVASVIAGAIAGLAEIAMWTGGPRDEEGRSNPIAALLLMLLAPLAATLVQLAISRSREYAADAMAAQTTKQPQSLANALLKISDIANQAPMNVNPAIASLYIANPLGVGGFLASLFSTHPPVEARVEALMSMQV
jgi:heat shock protein HtpX